VIKINDALLIELGLDALPTHLKKLMLKQIYSSLELRVGTVLAGQMTDKQLDEFEELIEGGEEDEALRWLEANFPDYKETVQDQFRSLKDEIRTAAPAILRNEGIGSEEPI
jgi:hypothetical protein